MKSMSAPSVAWHTYKIIHSAQNLDGRVWLNTIKDICGNRSNIIAAIQRRCIHIHEKQKRPTFDLSTGNGNKSFVCENGTVVRVDVPVMVLCGVTSAPTKKRGYIFSTKCTIEILGPRMRVGIS